MTKLCTSVKAGKEWAIIQYEKEDAYAPTASGLIIPSARQQRISLKGKDHTIGRDEIEIPDIIRAGRLVDGNLDMPRGSTVFFNKHDAVGFTVDEYFLYAIPARLVVAALSTPTA